MTRYFLAISFYLFGQLCSGQLGQGGNVAGGSTEVNPAMIVLPEMNIEGVPVEVFFRIVNAAGFSQAPGSGRGSIEGTVLDGNGVPLHHAVVYALPEEEMLKPIFVTTDETGKFILKDIPAGNVYVSAYKESDGYPYNFFSFFAMPGEQKPKVEVKSGETTKDVVVHLGAKAAYLNILIANEQGDPLDEGVQLIFTRLDVPGYYQTAVKTRKSLQVPPVPFRLRAEAKGYETWHYGGEKWEGNEGLISLKSGESLSVSIRLRPSSSHKSEN